MLSGVNQTEKDKDYMILFICRILKKEREGETKDNRERIDGYYRQEEGWVERWR